MMGMHSSVLYHQASRLDGPALELHAWQLQGAAVRWGVAKVAQAAGGMELE